MKLFIATFFFFLLESKYIRIFRCYGSVVDNYGIRQMLFFWTFVTTRRALEQLCCSGSDSFSASRTLFSTQPFKHSSSSLFPITDWSVGKAEHIPFSPHFAPQNAFSLSGESLFVFLSFENCERILVCYSLWGVGLRPNVSGEKRYSNLSLKSTTLQLAHWWDTCQAKWNL